MKKQTTILLTAVQLACSQGLRNLKLKEIAKVAQVATGTVIYHFTSMDSLREAVVAYAIENEIIEVLVQARAERNPRLGGKLSPALKARVANRITGK